MTTQLAQTPPRGVDQTSWPLFICVLGSFRVLQAGQPLAGLSGGKAEALLGLLALRYDMRVPRDTLLAGLWPDTDPVLARQSLNSLVYSLHKHLGGALGGAPPIEYADGYFVTGSLALGLAAWERASLQSLFIKGAEPIPRKRAMLRDDEYRTRRAETSRGRQAQG